MFVHVHDLEYVCDTGSLFICSGLRWKDGKSPRWFSQMNKAAWFLPDMEEPASEWVAREGADEVVC